MGSFAFLASSVFRGPMGATITVLFSLFVLPALDAILDSKQVLPWFSPYYSVNNIFSYLMNEGNGQTFPFPIGVMDSIPVAFSISIIVTYIVTACAFSIYFFNRREM